MEDPTDFNFEVENSNQALGFAEQKAGKKKRYSGSAQKQRDRKIATHHEFGKWQENHMFHPPGPIMANYPSQEVMSGVGLPVMASVSAKRKRNAASHKSDKQRFRDGTPQHFAHGTHYPMMMRPHPQMGYHPAGPFFQPIPYENFMLPATPSSTMPPLRAMQTFSESGASFKQISQTEEVNKKNLAKIELLEKKIRAKDALFDDALASTIASSCACSKSGGLENRNLTSELKRRFLKLKTRYQEAEAEIERLTKTVKVVEIEVRADTDHLQQEIDRLISEKFELQQSCEVQQVEIARQNKRIADLEAQQTQELRDREKLTSELRMFQDKISSLTLDLKMKVQECEASQTELSAGRS